VEVGGDKEVIMGTGCLPKVLAPRPPYPKIADLLQR